MEHGARAPRDRLGRGGPLRLLVKVDTLLAKARAGEIVMPRRKVKTDKPPPKESSHDPAR